MSADLTVGGPSTGKKLVPKILTQLNVISVINFEKIWSSSVILRIGRGGRANHSKESAGDCYDGNWKYVSVVNK